MRNKSLIAFNPKVFLKLCARKTAREYQNHQAIFSQGDMADAMFYIESGNVNLTVLSKRGKKAVIAILRRGDFFGEGCLARQAVRICTATAIHQSTIWRVTKPALIRVIREDATFAKVFNLVSVVSDRSNRRGSG